MQKLPVSAGYGRSAAGINKQSPCSEATGAGVLLQYFTLYVIIGRVKKHASFSAHGRERYAEGCLLPMALQNGEQHEKRGISGAAYVSQKEVIERSVSSVHRVI